MTKCWDIEKASDVVVDAFMTASDTSDIYRRKEIIFNAFNEVKKNVDPELLDEVIAFIDECVETYEDIGEAAAGYKNVFNPEFSIEKKLDRLSKLNGEEADSEKINRKAKVKREFLMKRFTDPDKKTAAQARLYFEKWAKNKLMDAFIVNRSKRIFVNDSNIVQNVKNLKQDLIDTIVDYLQEIGYNQATLGETSLYNEFGEFQNILDPGTKLSKAIKDKLELGVSFTTSSLNNAYNNSRTKQDNWQRDKKFLDAYNALVLLKDFDAITTMVLGNVVSPGALFYNDLSNSVYNTKFSRATNMWGNGIGDDNKDVADLISYVTQYLIETSRKYTWRGDVMEDQYLKFGDFNYIVTKVKDLIKYSELTKNIIFNDLFFSQNANKNYKISDDTKRTLDSLRKMRIKNDLDPNPTFDDVLCFISDNPQRHLHTIFDLLCNTNLVTYFPIFNDNDKNLIWTVGKEIFGSWPTEIDADGTLIYSRSLYDLCDFSNDTKIYEIVTQVADSMFAEEFIQYYEDSEGTLKMRLLLDYAVQQVRNRLLYAMRQTNGLLDEKKFSNFVSDFGIQINYRDPLRIISPGEKNQFKAWRVENESYDKDDPKSSQTNFVEGRFIKNVSITIGPKDEPNVEWITIESDGSTVKDLTFRKTLFTKEVEKVWKSKELRDFIKATIGIDFNSNVELAAAYEEGFKKKNHNNTFEVDYISLLNDICKLCGSVVFNQTFNNQIVPQILRDGQKQRTKYAIELLRSIQYVESEAPKIDPETGCVEMLSDNKKDAYLHKLGLAQATVSGLLTSAQVKSGEGTSLAAQCLSCLKESYAYQFLILNRNKNSATNHLTFVKNENGMFSKPMEMREFKSELNTKVNTDMSSSELFTASFLGGFVGAFINALDNSTINRKGKVYMAPAVNSDKGKLTIQTIDLNKEATYHPGKTYAQLTNEELEVEIKQEFSQMYDKIINNINEENFKFAKVLGINSNLFLQRHPIIVYRNLLKKITRKICDDQTLLNLAEDKFKNTITGNKIKELKKQRLSATEILQKIKQSDDVKETLAKIKKDRITSQIHEVMVGYNRNHRRKPIEMCEQIHYLFDKDGNLVPNDTLIALWGRFNGDLQTNQELGITDLYPSDRLEASTLEGYFKYEKDARMAYELLRDGVDIFLLGNLSKQKQEEIKYLRENFPSWVTDSGKMAIAKIFVPDFKYRVGDLFTDNTGITTKITERIVNQNGVQYTIESQVGFEEPYVMVVSESYLDEMMPSIVESQRGSVANEPGKWKITHDANLVKSYANSPIMRDMIKIHPMLSKINRISYLTGLQYTSSIGGAHYVYKAGGKNILEEEASRWLASNKRNVCYTATVHKFQNKSLIGVPKMYQIAPLEDIKSKIYNIMGDLDSHKPIDGGMYVNPWLVILENNSLAGEAAGYDKKQFGTYYYEKYAAGGIIKTAGFAITNQRLRNSIPYRNLCQNLTDRTWIKEFTDKNGFDIEEIIDITRDYNGNILDWVQDANGHGTYYERVTSDGKLLRFKLARIESLGNNQYKIYEFPVNSRGEIETDYPGIREQIPDSHDTSPEAEALRKKELEPIQRIDDSENGIFTINTNWKLYNFIFGGMNSLSLNEDGYLEESENSVLQMVHALNNIGYTRTTENNDPNFGDERYDIDKFDKIKTQDELWQPLKYSDIQYAPNIGALKSTQMNVNPKEAMYEKTYLNAMNIVMAQLGIQLDKEHHADDSEVSMPTQIIQACANKGYTIDYADKLYKSLSILTELTIADCMDGIMELMPGHENKGKLLTEIANIIVNKLIATKDDNQALEAVMGHLIEKAKGGNKLVAEDVVGKIAWSDVKAYSKIYSDLSTHLTNNAIKMKFPGTLSVICPTEKMEQMYGDRRLSAYKDTDSHLSEELGLTLHQQEIREGKHPNQLIYDAQRDSNTTVTEKLSIASNLDTQHHYWIEWQYSDGTPVMNGSDIFRESVTIDEPKEYYKLKNRIAYGGLESDGEITIHGVKIPRKGLMISKVYENITEGRELGAYNARFNAIGSTQRFSIFDLDSVSNLFEYNDMLVNFKNAKDLLDDKFIEPQIDFAKSLIERLLEKKYKESFNKIVQNIPDPESYNLIQIVENLDDNVKKDFAEAAFKVCRVLTYKQMEKDLFAISKNYEGKREVYVNGDLITVDPNTIKTQAYELIMPKVYQSKFGLETGDQVQEILADKDFFVKRAIKRVKEQHVAENHFHYELKQFNGEHIYIFDSRQGLLDPSIFSEKEIRSVEDTPSKWIREDLDGNYMYDLSSEKDKVVHMGALGYEIIVTDNPEFYLENMKYNIAAFSNKTVNKNMISLVVANLKNSKSKRAARFVRSMTNKDGNLKEFKYLQERNAELQRISLDSIDIKSHEIEGLLLQFYEEGKELHASFEKSLDIIAGRIPAQSQQSFMPQRVVAFDNNDINTAYVSTFQLFLLGSDLIKLIMSDYKS